MATAAHLVTAPVIAALSGRVSLVAVPANVLAEPAVPVATVFGFGAAVIAPIWASGARGLAAPVRGVQGLRASVGIVTLAEAIDEAAVAPQVIAAAHEVAERLR